MVEHGQITTTLAKAKELRGYVERVVTYGKANTVHARRLAYSVLGNRTLVKKLFDEIAPAFADRNGGYTRVIKAGFRRGDNAPDGDHSVRGRIHHQTQKRQYQSQRPQ